MILLHSYIEMLELLQLLEEQALQSIQAVLERVLDVINGSAELFVDLVLESDQHLKVDLLRPLFAYKTVPDDALPQCACLR